MDIYKCKKCGERFLSCDLVRTKCSENECGAYMLTFCPKCFGKIEKEQEAVEPKRAPFPDASRSDGSWYFICGACSKPIDPIDKYCRECGRPILWKGH